MHLTTRLQTLHLANTFTIARSSVDTEEVVVVRLEHEGITAFGEGAPVSYWGESAAGLAAAIDADGAWLIGSDPLDLQVICNRLRTWDGPQGAKMALDGVVHDWFGKRLDQPLWRLLGLGRRTPPTSFTIAISSVEESVERIRLAPEFDIYKVKVGGPGDLERLEAIREVTPARLRIDGNEGWTFETARDLMPSLLRLGVEFVEQPFPADDLDSYLRYRQLQQRIPVLIDEGCKDLPSVPLIATYADGMVVKLSKCGGIREAHRMIHAARALRLSVMIGCMIESQLGISQGAQIAPLVDYVDLDGHLLITDAPFTGLRLDDGRLLLTETAGLGVVPATAADGIGPTPHTATPPPDTATPPPDAATPTAREIGREIGTGVRTKAVASLAPDRLAVFTGGLLHDLHAKTAHGVLRYGAREVVCVVDDTHAGRTASDVVPFCEREVPVVADVATARTLGATVLLVGIAPSGGKLTPAWRAALLSAVELGLDVEAGLHTTLSGDRDISVAAAVHGARIRDLRIAPTGLDVPLGPQHRVAARVIHTVGSDCAIGKMSVTLELDRAARRRGLGSVFVATGQTGIAISGWGIAVDHVISDYVARGCRTPHPRGSSPW